MHTITRDETRSVDEPDQSVGASHTPPRAQRTLSGGYRLSQRGRLAADGSLLDTVQGDHAVSSWWRDPACEYRQCWRPEILSMVPRESGCWRHQRPKPPLLNPFPLEGPELAVAQAEAWRTLAPKLGVPPKYANMTETYSTAALELAADYSINGVDSCLAIQGGPGVGKTVALYHGAYKPLILETVQRDLHHVTIHLTTFPELSTRLLDQELAEETLEVCRTADDLLIDDLGSGYTKSAGFVVACFEDIVIHREAADLPMLFTTNLEPKAFRALFGDRVFDRLRGSWGRWVHVAGGSLRGKDTR